MTTISMFCFPVKVISIYKRWNWILSYIECPSTEGWNYSNYTTINYELKNEGPRTKTTSLTGLSVADDFPNIKLIKHYLFQIEY